MKRRHLDDAIASIDPAASVHASPTGAGARELRDEIVATVDTPSRARRRPIPSMVGAAAAVALLVAVLVVDRPRTAAAGGIRFDRTPAGVTATVTDLAADPDAFRAAFREAGFDVTLLLVPASPSMVGQIVVLGGESAGLTALEGGGCPSENRCGPIGIRLEPSFSGSAEVTLGRPATEGELFVATGSAFAPGESMHCLASQSIGAPARDVADLLGSRDIRPAWRDATGHSISKPPAGSFASSFTPLGPRVVVVFTSPESVIDPEQVARLQRGCP